MPRRLFVITALIALVSFTGGIALAGDFADEAEKFYNRYCTGNYVTSIIAFVCHLQDQITNIELTPGPQGPQGEKGEKGDPGEDGQDGERGPAGPVLKVFDANGKELGPLVDPETFYYAPLKRLITVDLDVGEGQGHFAPVIQVYFESSDCTGTPLRPIPTANLNQWSNQLLTAGPGRYFIVNKDSPIINDPDIHSELNYNFSNDVFICQSQGNFQNATVLTEVQIPFDDPVPLPLRYGVE